MPVIDFLVFIRQLADSKDTCNVSTVSEETQSAVKKNYSFKHIAKTELQDSSYLSNQGSKFNEKTDFDVVDNQFAKPEDIDLLIEEENFIKKVWFFDVFITQNIQSIRNMDNILSMLSM